MMGWRSADQQSLFYAFNLDEIVPKNHLLRRIDPFVTEALGDLHAELAPFYSDIGRPSIDPELMIRMLMVGCCFGIRSERRLCDLFRASTRGLRHLCAASESYESRCLIGATLKRQAKVTKNR